MNQIYILQIISTNLQSYLWSSYTYKQLLQDLFILKYTLKNKNPLDIHKLNNKYKIIILLYGLLFNIDIYITGNNTVQNKKKNILTNDEIETILHTPVDENKLTGIYNEFIDLINKNATNKEDLCTITTYVNNNKYTIQWEDIFIFTEDFIIRYKDIHQEKEGIYIDNLDKMYFIYFILVPITLHIPLHFIHSNKSFIIGDFNTSLSSDIMITTKYTDTINVKYKYSIFYNYTIGQFLIHTTKITDSHMLGKLYPYIRIHNKTIYYNNLLLQLPPSYVLKDTILFIKKKGKKKSKKNFKKNTTSQNKTIYTLQKLEKNMYTTTDSSIVVLTLYKKNITDILCKQLYDYIINKHIYTKTTYTHLYNICLVSKNHQNKQEKQDGFINKSFFSMHFILDSNQILISYNCEIEKHIGNIIQDLNNIIDNMDQIPFFFEKKILKNNVLQHAIQVSSHKNMNMHEFLHRFSFCSILSYSIYYYKYKNSMWDIQDIEHIVDYSKKNSHHSKIPFGYHYIVELHLDIGIDIIIELRTKISFYIKYDRTKHFKENNIKLNLVQTFTEIDRSVTIIDLFTQLFKKNNDLLYFTTYTNNCAQLSLHISKILLTNKNDYILLENKLKNNIDKTHMIECLTYLYTRTKHSWNIVPTMIKNKIVDIFSTKYFNHMTINKKILGIIKKNSLIQKKLLYTIPNYSNLSSLLAYNTIYKKNTEMITYKNILFLKKQLYYLISVCLYSYKYYSYNFKHTEDNKLLIDTKHKYKNKTRLQLKYTLTKDEMDYLTSISIDLDISKSDVLRLFLIKTFLIYFKNYYFIIHKKNYNYFIPYLSYSIKIPQLSNIVTTFTNNNVGQHMVYKYVSNRINNNKYIINTYAKGIYIKEIELENKIHNIDIDKIYTNTHSYNKPISITIINKDHTYDINVSYDGYYKIKNIFKELFIILQLYAEQNKNE